MSKIVVLTGSPRRGGNSMAMVEAFIDRAQALGHEVRRYDCAFMHLEGCHACETCFKTGSACSFKDEFNTMAPALEEADALVFAAPVYWYSFPAQIKAAIDKMFSFVIGGKDITGKKCALIACCEEHDPTVLDGISKPFARIAALNGWQSVGEVLVPGVLNPGDIAKTDGCARAAALAEKI